MSLPSLREEFNKFPKLVESSNFSFKSKYDQNYNCIAWAIIRNDVWVDPSEALLDGIFWPKEVPKGNSYNHLILLFNFFEYQECIDSSFEDGFMKVALYGKNGNWSHASRQLLNGKWTSKMGMCEDIEHNDPADLEGEGYGVVYRIMKRPNSSYNLKKIKVLK